MNNNCKMIHETSLAHIMDIWNALVDISKDSKDAKDKRSKGPMKANSSIAKASSNLTMVFPVLCSRGISIEAASMVSKALEKNAVSMMQRLFASWQLADSDVKSLADYISKFHGNLSTRVASLDDVFRLEDSVGNFKANGSHKFSEANMALAEAAVKEDMRNINFYLAESVNNAPLTSFIVHEKNNVDQNVSADFSTNIGINNFGTSNSTAKALKDLGSLKKSEAEYFKNQVLDSEYKKANELMPTMMTVNFYTKEVNGDNTTVVPYENAVAAVKAKLYPISSNDIVNHLSDKMGDKNWLTNFLRASTREISFMKDFVLAIDKAKIDALSLSDRNRTTDKMWKVLERRAITSRLKRAMRRPDSASVAAITTLVISQEEVEYLRKHHSIDIEKVSAILNLFESLNLMCVCIVDESLEVAKFIYDEQEPMWETISFTHLEREASDNTYKKVVNLMTKISR